MKPGTLNRRCVLQAKTSGVDSIGQPVDAWTDVVSFWANIKTTSGYEIAKSDAVTQVNRVSIRARYMLRPFVNAGMRVMSGGVAYNVEAVMADESGREYVDLVCEVLT